MLRARYALLLLAAASSCGVPLVGAWPPDAGAPDSGAADAGCACSEPGCSRCGADPRCDGARTLAHETTVLSYLAECRAALAACGPPQAGAIVLSAGALQRCEKVNGSWAWRPSRSSASAGGLGCAAHCDYACSTDAGTFCDAQADWSADLGSAPLDGCGALSPLPGGYACP